MSKWKLLASVHWTVMCTWAYHVESLTLVSSILIFGGRICSFHAFLAANNLDHFGLPCRIDIC
jgi:hypothetical protein